MPPTAEPIIIRMSYCLPIVWRQFFHLEKTITILYNGAIATQAQRTDFRLILCLTLQSKLGYFGFSEV